MRSKHKLEKNSKIFQCIAVMENIIWFLLRSTLKIDVCHALLILRILNRFIDLKSTWDQISKSTMVYASVQWFWADENKSCIALMVLLCRKMNTAIRAVLVMLQRLSIADTLNCLECPAIVRISLLELRINFALGRQTVSVLLILC